MSIFGKKPPGSAPETPAPTASPGATPPPPAAASTGRYAIDDAIKLMRTLPFDTDPELVGLVMKNTLASMHVNVADLVAEAGSRQDGIRTRIAELHAEIAALDAQLADKRKLVGSCDSELAEVSAVRRRLEASTVATKGAPVMRSQPRPPEGTPSEPGVVRSAS